MMIDCHLTDGRTVFRAMSRGSMIKLFSNAEKADKMDDDDASVSTVWVRWHPQSPWERIRLLTLKKHSVAFTRKIEAPERDEFIASLPEEERPARPARPKVEARA